MYSDGRATPKDPQKAFELYKVAAEDGFAPAQVELGISYHKGRGIPEDIVQAARWFSAAAEQGDCQGQNHLALLYAEGKGVPVRFRREYLV